MKIIKITRTIVVALLLLVTVLPSLADEKGKAEPYTLITSKQLKDMIDRQDPDLIVIDARTPGEYQEVHIPTAVSIPWPQLEKDKSLLNFPKEKKLAFYCNGFK